ncbi:MAG: hypothetical protein AAF170_13250 [Bacteroidota bacterium]
MRRTLFLGFGILFLGAAGAPVALDRIELAPGTDTRVLGQAFLPCEVTVRAANRSARTVAVDLNDSQVKTKSGLWTTLEAEGGKGVCTEATMGLAARSDTKVSACTLESPCTQERRYKFKLTYDGNIAWAYYPSANGWTTDTDLDLGDIGRHFRGF